MSCNIIITNIRNSSTINTIYSHLIPRAILINIWFFISSVFISPTIFRIIRMWSKFSFPYNGYSIFAINAIYSILSIRSTYLYRSTSSAFRCRSGYFLRHPICCFSSICMPSICGSILCWSVGHWSDCIIVICNKYTTPIVTLCSRLAIGTIQYH